MIDIIGEYDGLVVRSGTKVTKDVIEAGTKLKIIGRAGTGVDNIDIKAATDKGILVVNTPGGNTISTGELALAHILSLARNIPQATAALKGGKWARSQYTGTELAGKTLGVVGVGRIGREVASWCKGFGMTVVGYDPILSEGSSRSYGIEPLDINELLKKSDFITIHTPLTETTKHIFNSDSLKLCKPGVRIVNCARGGIVDEKAILDALNSGQVGGCALDVFESEPPKDDSLELRMHPKCVVTPHLGASTNDAQERVAKDIARNMSEIFDGGSFIGVVNAPDLSVVSQNPAMIPFIILAEKLGSIQAQLLKNNKINSITIDIKGCDVADPKFTDIIKSAVVKGALGELVSQSVTYVNAISLAKEMGLKVYLNMTDETEAASGFKNQLAVELEIEGMLNMRRRIEGTVFGRNELRITNFDGFLIDLPPGENILLFNNHDTPGILKKVAESLAKDGANIAHFSVGRTGQAKQALGAIVLDTPLSNGALKALGNNDEVSNVTMIKLRSEVDPNFRVRSSALLGQQGVGFGSTKPPTKPANPQFSSGPCKKRPGYNLGAMRTDVLGRSHRSKLGKSRLKYAIEETKRILGIPEDYRVGIVPASDTGAFEMAMWTMLGERPIDACFWESFGKGWNEDAINHLGLKDMTTSITAPYGQLPDFSLTNPDHDIMFTFNGTTSGVRVPNLDWISDDRKGLTFNDATSAAFAMHIDWSKVDVTTYSWQKVLGGEGAHGVLILSPRAIERLERYVPDRPLPKIFRLTKKGKFDEAIFRGDTINTPSMLCVEDYIDALEWANSIGGLNGLVKKSKENLAVMEKFVEDNDWIEFLAQNPSIRSNTSVCLTLPQLDKDQVKKMVSLLEEEGVAYDIGAYRDAPDGLRIWCGATVEKQDLEALLPWLKWAHMRVINEEQKV